MRTTLTIEQSQKFCSLGLSSYFPDNIAISTGQGEGWREIYYIRFCLTDLLAILPKDLGNDGYDTLCIETQSNGNNYFWRVYYSEHDADTNFCEDELIDALFELVVWCVENGFIKPLNH